jgi:hypothetical protein
MRALGPGSVSSLLKLVLDVIYFTLWGLVGAALVLALVALILPSDASIPHWLPAPGLLIAGVLLVAAIYLGVVLLIVDRVRRIFLTLIAGDPFEPKNVTRLRAVAFAMVALECIRFAANLSPLVFRKWLHWEHTTFNPTAWFAVLVVFVLAEVFREGARLRGEAELTI